MPAPGNDAKPGSNGSADSLEKDRPNSSGYELALSHYTSLKQYLREHFQKVSGVSPQRQSAREKLTKLTKQQFQELSTDVFDETNRRIMNSNEVPFLPVCDDFHPKRNQARQKLATLPESRFKDLASDVFAELERRYPVLHHITIPAKAEPVRADTVDVTKPVHVPIPTSGSRNGANAEGPQSNGNQTADAPPQYTVPQTGGSFGAIKKPTAAPAPAPAPAPVATPAPAPAPAVQESAKPIASLNFANLDSLMADLGNLMNTGSSSEVRRSMSLNMIDKNEHEAELQKQRKEFEGTIERLNKEIQNLNLELKEHVSKPDVSGLLKELNEQLREAKGTIDRLHREKEALEASNKQHQANVTHLQSALQEQKQANENLQMLNANELKTVRDELELAERQRELEKKRVKTLMDEKDKLELDLNEVQMENIGLKNEIKGLEAALKEKTAAIAKLSTASAPASNAASAAPAAPVANGVAGDAAKHAAAKSQVENYPISLNGYAGQPEDSDGIDPSRISAYKLAAEKLLESMQRDVTQMLFAIRGLVVAARNILEDSEAVEIRFGKSMSSVDRERLADIQNRINQQLQDLMAAAKRAATVQPVEQAENYHVMRTALSQLSVLVTEDIVRVLKTSSRQPQPTGMPLSAPPNSLLATKPTGLVAVPIGGTGSNSNVAIQRQNPLKDLQQPPPPQQPPVISSGAALLPAGGDGDNLKVFLEKQTDLIVQGIQNLLMAMKEAVFGEKFIGYVNSITQVVEQLIQTSRQALARPVYASKRAAGEKVLKELMGCNIKLKDLEIAMRSSPTYRPQRHVIAASVRDVANFTKELVKLLE